MNRYFPVFIFFLFPLWVHAQNKKVVGRVVDSEGKSVEAAVVYLLRNSDRYLLEYGTTDREGCFLLQSVKKGKAELIVKHLSYDIVRISIPEQCDTSVHLVLVSAAYEMEEVKVRGKRVPIQFERGDWIVDAEHFITAGTERSVDLMKRLPGISVNEETKQITLYGKPVDLQLNGVLQPMTYELLSALPADLLDQVVLTPVKRAEHEGVRSFQNAMVNVKTKKKYIDGFTGYTDGSYGLDFGNHLPGDGDGSFFVMLMKKNFYLNLMLKGYVYNEDSDLTDSTWYGFSETSMLTSLHSETKNEWGTSGNLNLSWDIKNGSRINVNAYFTQDQEPSESSSYRYDAVRHKSEHVRKDDLKRFSPTGNIQFETPDNRIFKLRTSYGYINNKVDNRYDYENRYTSGSSDDYTYFYDLSGRQHVLKLDVYRFFYKNKLFVGLGGNANFARTTNEIRYFPGSDKRQNEDFDYKERVSEGYLNITYDISKKIHIGARLRAQYTDYDLKLASESLKTDNHYWNLAPSLNARFDFSEKYIAQFSLSRNIIRPNYNALTPGVRYVSDKFYYTGNPWLEPAKQFYIEYLHLLFRRFSISTDWEYTKDLYTSVLIDRGDGVIESSYRNCFDRWSVLIKFRNTWEYLDGRLNLEGNIDWHWGKYRNMQDGFTVPRNRQTYLEGYFGFDFWLTKNYRWKVNGNVKLNVYDKSFQSDGKMNTHANIGLRYKCLDSRSLYVTLQATDIFNTSGQRTTWRYGNNVRHTKMNKSYQGITIGLSYSFQGGKDLKRREVEQDVNEEDKRFD